MILSVFLAEQARIKLYKNQGVSCFSELIERIPASIIERILLDQMRKGVKDREVGFKKQAFKQNVKFHAAQKFRADRPSRLHKRAAARAHHGNNTRRLGLRKHGCGCSSCRDRQRRWRHGQVVTARCRMRRLQRHGDR